MLVCVVGATDVVGRRVVVVVGGSVVDVLVIDPSGAFDDGVLTGRVVVPVLARVEAASAIVTVLAGALDVLGAAGPGVVASALAAWRSLNRCQGPLPTRRDDEI